MALDFFYLSFYCLDTEMLTAVPIDCPKMRIRDGGMPATFMAQSTTASASMISPV